MSNLNLTRYPWFTADTHLGHSRIIEYCDRPFKDADHMQEDMLERFNSVLRPGDLLYHLGDVAWSSYDLSKFFDRLATKSVHLIYGNHDKKHPSEYRRFQWTGDYKKITVGSIPVVLCHYPFRSWNTKGHGGFHFYGHCHGTIEPGLGRSMDVGVDTHDYRPWSWEEIYEKLKDIPMFQDDPRDSHNQRG